MAFAKIEMWDTGDTVDFNLNLDGVDLTSGEVDVSELTPAQTSALHMWQLYVESLPGENDAP